MGHWKNKLLSKARKEMLLKAVTRAIPNFAMSCFRLPQRLYKEIWTMMTNYWWGQNNKQDKQHWIAWEKFIKDKKKKD